MGISDFKNCGDESSFMIPNGLVFVALVVLGVVVFVKDEVVVFVEDGEEVVTVAGDVDDADTPPVPPLMNEFGSPRAGEYVESINPEPVIVPPSTGIVRPCPPPIFGSFGTVGFCRPSKGTDGFKL